MQRSWGSARRALREAGRGGDVEAHNAYLMMLRMENDNSLTFTFENATLAGRLGEAQGTTARIDVAAIGRDRAAGKIVNVASTLVHEAGHLYYENTPMFAFRPDSKASQLNAMSWDNAYRRAIHWPMRANHNSYPYR